MSERAILSFLANSADAPAILDKGPEATVEELREGWILPDKQLDPDSVEAAEDAQVQDKNLRGARRTFRKDLNEKQRTTVLAAARLLGVGELADALS